MTVLNTIKQINERSVFLGSTVKATDKAIADHCIVIAEHIVAHGDVTAADFLCKQFSASGVRVNAIRQWFLDFGGCSWNADKKQFGKRKNFLFSVDVAKENPWYLHTKEQAFKPVNSETVIKAAIAKIKKAMEDTGDDAKKHTINKEHLRMMEAILSDKPSHYINEANKDNAPIIPSAPEAAEQPSVH